MSTNFSTFVVSETTINQIKVLPEETQLKFFWAVTNYGIDGIEPDFIGLELAIWIPMRDLIINSKKKDEEWHEKQREHGKKGANKRWQPYSRDSNPIPEMASLYANGHNDNDNDNDNDNGNENHGESAITDGSDEPPQSQTDAIDLANTLLTTHRSEIPDYLAGKDDRQTVFRWAQDIEKLIRIDKKPPETIRRVILWAKTPGNFWFHNIESGKKLREKFERLYGQMLSDTKATSPPKHRIAADNVSADDYAGYFTEAVL